MNHERQTCAASPLHLTLESLHLLLLELTAPVEVEAYLADGYHLVGGHLLHFAEHVVEVGLHLFGMQPYHGVCEARVLMAYLKHPRHRRQVDGRHEDMPHPRLTGTLDDVVAVGVKLLTIDMYMCVDKLHQHSLSSCLR